ncbi:MAG: hypothetical protein ACSNEK_10200 [Parachlamydiaceae bacterium]
MLKYLTSLIVAIVCQWPIFAEIDLEKDQQSFVIETKKIAIKGYPDAFNPSMTKWHGRYLLSFRARDPLTNLTTLVGLTWLDAQLNPTGEPQLINTQGKNHTDFIQDPRLIVVDNRLYMAYSAQCLYEGRLERRMCLAEIFYNGKSFSISQPDPIFHFEGNGNKFEKNWVPFVYNGYLLLSYSIFPHKVFLPLLGEQKCLTVDYSEAECLWKWGEVRGGTPALPIGEGYLSFFHTSTVMKTVHSNGKAMPHYFMGAYIFEKKPPFHVKKISPKPIVGNHFYKGPTHKTWKPLRVVFPGGYIVDETFIWIAYGRQDHEVWIVKLDKQALLKSLVPVKQIL